MSEIMVSNVSHRARFEASIDERLAGFMDYRDEGDVRLIPHTEVKEEFSGQGVAGTLVRQALEITRKEGLKVRPECSYVASWIDKHEDYQDLLA